MEPPSFFLRVIGGAGTSRTYAATGNSVVSGPVSALSRDPGRCLKLEPPVVSCLAQGRLGLLPDTWVKCTLWWLCLSVLWVSKLIKPNLRLQMETSKQYCPLTAWSSFHISKARPRDSAFERLDVGLGAESWRAVRLGLAFTPATVAAKKLEFNCSFQLVGSLVRMTRKGRPPLHSRLLGAQAKTASKKTTTRTRTPALPDKKPLGCPVLRGLPGLNTSGWVFGIFDFVRCG